jgi:hypothetical protein
MHQYIGAANRTKYMTKKNRTVSPTSPVRLNGALPIFILLEEAGKETLVFQDGGQI